MTTAFIIKVIFEVGAAVLILYGIRHEDKLVAFEDRILAALKDRAAQKHPTRGAGKNKKRIPSSSNSNHDRKSDLAAQRKAAMAEFAAREQRANTAAAARKAAAELDRRTPAEIILDRFADWHNVA